MELPIFQSHKQVQAVKIAAIEIGRDGEATIAPIKAHRAPGDSVVYTKTGYGDKFNGSEEDLGYYVLYAGGYESWSPTKAFEEGYTRIE